MSTNDTPTPIAAQAGSRRERPILCSGPMVQAIIEDRKPQDDGPGLIQV